MGQLQVFARSNGRGSVGSGIKIDRFHNPTHETVKIHEYVFTLLTRLRETIVFVDPQGLLPVVLIKSLLGLYSTLS